MASIAFLRTWFSQLTGTSVAYRIAMLVMVLIYVFASYFFVLAFLGDLVNKLSFLFLKTLSDALTLALFCHVFLRPFLRLGVVEKGLNSKTVTSLLLYLLPVSVLLSVAGYLISIVPVFSDTEISSVQFQSNDGSITERHMSFSAYLLASLQNYFVFLFWSSLYVAWHVYRNRNELQKELDVARLQQLANQINPHFLFNTLNSVRALVYSDQDKAAHTITQLSELMRVQMHADVEVVSSLDKELKLGEQYLQIEQLRLQERLQIERDIDPALIDKKLPSLVVLTLLENAIKYGVAPSRGAGLIAISAAKLEADRWQLKIENSVPAKKVAQGNGIGLKNIQKRLQLLYKERAKMSVSNGERFCVSLELPSDEYSDR